MSKEEFEEWLWEFGHAMDDGRDHFDVLRRALERFDEVFPCQN